MLRACSAHAVSAVRVSVQISADTSACPVERKRARLSPSPLSPSPLSPSPTPLHQDAWLASVTIAADDDIIVATALKCEAPDTPPQSPPQSPLRPADVKPVPALLNPPRPAAVDVSGPAVSIQPRPEPSTTRKTPYDHTKAGSPRSYSLTAGQINVMCRVLVMVNQFFNLTVIEFTRKLLFFNQSDLNSTRRCQKSVIVFQSSVIVFQNSVIVFQSSVIIPVEPLPWRARSALEAADPDARGVRAADGAGRPQVPLPDGRHRRAGRRRVRRRRDARTAARLHRHRGAAQTRRRHGREPPSLPPSLAPSLRLPLLPLAVPLSLISSCPCSHLTSLYPSRNHSLPPVLHRCLPPFLPPFEQATFEKEFCGNDEVVTSNVDCRIVLPLVKRPAL